ncbi:acyl-CoA dehydrogenase [Malaciobacter halophilus]|nr:acyl-CoA dehydrogenase domain-containing protein [Malaciobacter halophilus]AXH09478.1 acyl-CoA dehydrogenase [Malaciobacter halophilus]
METLIFFVIVLIFGFFSYPAILWFIFIGLYSLIFFDLSILFWIIFTISAIAVLNKEVRQHFIIKPFLNFQKENNFFLNYIYKNNLTLQVDTNSMETNIFKGIIDFDKINKNKNNNLSKKEQDFLDNEVEKLCSFQKSYETFKNNDLNTKTWQFLKNNKFLAILIPKEYEGLGFSLIAYFKIIEKLASCNLELATLISNLNCSKLILLLLKYGTNEQKDHYLRKIAKAQEIPYFNLNEQINKYDEQTINSIGTIFKNSENKIKIKVDFEINSIKKTDTQTLMELAFILKDPNNLLFKKKNLGVCIALIDLKKENFVIDIDNIIGAKQGIGKGLQMLNDTFNVNEFISFQSIIQGRSKLILKTITSQIQLKNKDKITDNNFEAVENEIVKIAAFTYLLKTSNNHLLKLLKNENGLFVTSLIMKSQSSKLLKKIMGNTIDISNNINATKTKDSLFIPSYLFAISLANNKPSDIFIKNFELHKQAMIQLNPQLFEMANAIYNNDIDSFDKIVQKSVALTLNLNIKSLIYFFTKGKFIKVDKGLKEHKKRVIWATTHFAALINLTLLSNTKLQNKEFFKRDFTSILSWLYLIVLLINEYDNTQNSKYRILIDYICQYGFYKIQKAKERLTQNSTYFKFLLPFIRFNPYALKPNAKLTKKIIDLLKDKNSLDKLCQNLYFPKDNKETLYKIEEALKCKNSCETLIQRVKYAVTHNTIEDTIFLDLIKAAHDKGVITNDEYTQLIDFHNKRNEVF